MNFNPTFLKTFILVFITFLTVQNGFSQCCSSGSPLGASSFGGLVAKKSLRINSFARYSQSKDYFSGTKEIKNFGLVSYADFLFHGLTVAYGLSKRVNIETELGYFYKKTVYFIKEPGFPQLIYNGNGLTNGLISAKYSIIKLPAKGLELTIATGLRFPFSTKQKYDQFNVLLPIDVQPSTNAFGWMGQTIFQKEYKPKKLILFLFSRYEQNTTNKDNYKYGDKLRTSVMASKKLKKNFGVMLQARHEYIGQDISNGAKQIFTGANLVFLSPQLLYSLKSKWNLMAGAEMPVYKNYLGTQISNRFSVNLGFTRDFCL